jgi:hypothetical protein
VEEGIVLVTQETITVISGMGADRCRFDDGLLFVLDRDTHARWVFRGLEKLGTIAGDHARAVDLLNQAPLNKEQMLFNFVKQPAFWPAKRPGRCFSNRSKPVLIRTPSQDQKYCFPISLMYPQGWMDTKLGTVKIRPIQMPLYSRS